APGGRTRPLRRPPGRQSPGGHSRAGAGRPRPGDGGIPPAARRPSRRSRGGPVAPRAGGAQGGRRSLTARGGRNASFRTPWRPDPAALPGPLHNSQNVELQRLAGVTNARGHIPCSRVVGFPFAAGAGSSQPLIGATTMFKRVFTLTALGALALVGRPESAVAQGVSITPFVGYYAPLSDVIEEGGETIT